MSSKTIYCCDWDGCKEQRAGKQSLQAFSHSSADASGNGSEQWYAVFDLCIEHLITYTESLTESLERYGKHKVKIRSPFEIVKDLHINYELR